MFMKTNTWAVDIKEKRVSLGFSQEQMAKFLECSKSTIEKWERGIKTPGPQAQLAYLQRLAGATPIEKIRRRPAGPPAEPATVEVCSDLPQPVWKEFKEHLDRHVRGGALSREKAEGIRENLVANPRRLIQNPSNVPAPESALAILKLLSAHWHHPIFDEIERYGALWELARKRIDREWKLSAEERGMLHLIVRYTFGCHTSALEMRDYADLATVSGMKEAACRGLLDSLDKRGLLSLHQQLSHPTCGDFGMIYCGPNIHGSKSDLGAAWRAAAGEVWASESSLEWVHAGYAFIAVFKPDAYRKFWSERERLLEQLQQQLPCVYRLGAEPRFTGHREECHIPSNCDIERFDREHWFEIKDDFEANYGSPWWEEIAGEHFGHCSSLVKIEDGTAYISCKPGPDRDNLKKAAPWILDRLQNRFHGVESIRFAAGACAPPSSSSPQVTTDSQDPNEDNSEHAGPEQVDLLSFDDSPQDPRVKEVDRWRDELATEEQRCIWDCLVREMLRGLHRDSWKEFTENVRIWLFRIRTIPAELTGAVGDHKLLKKPANKPGAWIWSRIPPECKKAPVRR
jgi:transcriptional regulator with XRE-family HTH domain